MHVYWIYMYTIKIYIERAFFWVFKPFPAKRGSKYIHIFQTAKQNVPLNLQILSKRLIKHIITVPE